MSEQPEKLKEIVHVDCNACGSEMVYDPAKQMMLCNHCGNSQGMPKDSDRVVEHSYSECLDLDSQETGFGTESKVFHCNNCGAETAVSPETVNFECPFCASTNVNEEAQAQRVIRPAGILPFKISRQVALEKFRVWIKKGFFSPSKLKRLARLEKIHSVYLPFWTYDADTRSQWTALSGHHYYVTETSTNSKGETQTKQVQKTRWVPAGGYYARHFDDVLVLGSHGLTQQFSERIFPFNLEEVVNYDSRFILGHESEIYQKDVNEGLQVAEGIMDSEIRSAVVRQIPGDTYKNLNINTHKSGVTFKHILLPIWIAAYKFNNKVYKFLVNGQTGKISGKKPISVGKVILVIGIVAAIIGAIVFLTSS
jgi:predicted RNA-binding Zn-ribbon protein involved in translation (DUF1610 family)